MGKNAHQDIPWSELPIFLALAREKTLSAAARRLAIDRTTVARRIQALEATMGRALFDRTDGNFQLTLLGRKAFSAVERANQELSFFGQALGGERHPLGKVRLSIPPHLAFSLAEPLTRFQSENPQILLELKATDQLASLMRHDTDVALRLSLEPPKGMTRYKLGVVPLRLFERAGGQSDLTRYISYPGADSIDKTIKSILPNAEITLSIDGYVPMREAIAQGAGVGMLPSDFGEEDPRLTPVSDRLYDNDMFLWLICLPEQRRLTRIQTLMSFLRAEYAAE
ncbi:LysR family transcriptional regulator [Shimia sp. NS0008-38b]|uniref:LysR family transcriptional regulator n=1 Tax=Shimia sp. NS0008-38b TaxID=3127653 RepID=UPI00310867F9